jgi:hypothetical protein
VFNVDDTVAILLTFAFTVELTSPNVLDTLLKLPDIFDNSVLILLTSDDTKFKLLVVVLKAVLKLLTLLTTFDDNETISLDKFDKLDVNVEFTELRLFDTKVRFEFTSLTSDDTKFRLLVVVLNAVLKLLTLLTTFDDNETISLDKFDKLDVNVEFTELKLFDTKVRFEFTSLTSDDTKFKLLVVLLNAVLKLLTLLTTFDDNETISLDKFDTLDVKLEFTELKSDDTKFKLLIVPETTDDTLFSKDAVLLNPALTLLTDVIVLFREEDTNPKPLDVSLSTDEIILILVNPYH